LGKIEAALEKPRRSASKKRRSTKGQGGVSEFMSALALYSIEGAAGGVQNNGICPPKLERDLIPDTKERGD